MGFYRASVLVWLTLCVAGTIEAAPPPGGVPLSVEQRLSRIERLVDSDALIDILERLSQIEADLQVMRGNVEEQGHALKGIKNRQRELYLDVDRRLQGVQGQTTAASSNSTGIESNGSANTQVVVTGATNHQEQDSYQAAFQLLKEGKYESAAVALDAFLKDYPQSNFAANAQYWLGETHYVTRNFTQAQQEFNQVIEQYPDSAKVPDALLKISYIYFEHKDWEKSRTILQRIISDHANSSAAHLAEVKLRQIP